MAEGDHLPPASLHVMANSRAEIFVEWTREAGPAMMAGWHLERQNPNGSVVRVSERMVEPGLFDEPASLYRARDFSATAMPGTFLSYRLVVVDAELHERPSAFAAYEVAAEAAEVLAPSGGRALKESALPELPAPAAAGPGSRVRIVVTNDGLYRLTAAQIAGALAGYDTNQAAAAIAQTNFSLTCGGESVAWLAETNGTALLFFGQAYRDVYADRNVYFLAPGPGVAMGFTNRATAAVAADPWFWETVRVEKNVYFLYYVAGGTEDDYFIWDGKMLTSTNVAWQWTTNVALVDAHPAVKEGAVTAYLVSGYDGMPDLDNHTRLSAAGQLLDDRQWPGHWRLAQSGVATNLGGSSVAVTVGFQRETSVVTTTVLIDALEVRYARRLRAQNNQLKFAAEAGTNVLTVRGFSNAAIRALDVGDPLRPVEIAATVAAESATVWRASWAVDPAAGGRYLAVARTSSPVLVEGVADTAWNEARTGAPHLVIAPRALTNAAAALVAYRQQQGLDSLLVPVEELYDAFAFGRPDPRAIPRFLAHALAQWTIPPQYVCLAGDGHQDYHDYYGQSGTRPNHIPPIQDRIPVNAVGTTNTLGLDIPLGDVDGDGMPDMAIGRLPAQTSAALTRMINRIVAHEASDAWKTNVFMVADKDDNDVFGQACARLTSHVPPGMPIQQLTHTSNMTAAVMSNLFVRGFNSGIPLLVYLGHANNVGMGSPYFFEHSSARSYMPALTNYARTPLLLAGTCMLNDYAAPYATSRCLGKGFLDTATGGAVAVWASASESTLYDSERTSAAILDVLFASNDVRLGDLVAAALDVETQYSFPWLVRASVLMGDPGTRIRTHLALDHVPPAIQIRSPASGPTCAVTSNLVDLAGTAADFNGVWRVVARNARNGSEFLAAGTTNWSLVGLPLLEGANPIAVIAYDSAGNAATAVLEVVWGMVPPLVQITAPTAESVFATTTNALNLAGTASDYSGIVRVAVANSRISGEHAAAGTTHWTLQGLPLAPGTNWITAVAFDGVGNSATAGLQVVRTVIHAPPEGQITSMSKVAGGLELTWHSLAYCWYRVAWANTVFGPFQPLGASVLATNGFGRATLPLDLPGAQLYFKVLWSEDNDG